MKYFTKAAAIVADPTVNTDPANSPTQNNLIQLVNKASMYIRALHDAGAIEVFPSSQPKRMNISEAAAFLVGTTGDLYYLLISNHRLWGKPVFNIVADLGPQPRITIMQKVNTGGLFARFVESYTFAIAEGQTDLTPQQKTEFQNGILRELERTGQLDRTKPLPKGASLQL